MDALTPELLAAAALIVFAGALVFCTVGFGIGVTSIPLLMLLFDARTAVVAVNAVSLLMFALVIWQTRREIPFRQALPMSAAGVAGVPVGVWALNSVDASALRIGIAALIIALTALGALGARWTPPAPRIAVAAAGFVVSVMLNAFGVGGALLALALLARDMRRQALRGSLSLYFLVVEGVGVALYAASGLLTGERLALIGAAALPVVLGFWAAALASRRMNEVAFRRAVIAAVVITSAVVIAREVLALLWK